MDLKIQFALSTGAILTGFSMTSECIPRVADYFLHNTKLSGIDMGKKTRKRIPESLGIIVGINYFITFITWFIFVPTAFMGSTIAETLTYSNLAALTSILAMLLLGFVDDCYDIKWRYKLVLPFAASVPLLLVYYNIYSDKTVIIVPAFLQFFGISKHLDLGILYYMYMLMFVIFCTNAINIYAGINGIEVGQSIVVASFVILYNLIEIYLTNDCDEAHIFPLNLLLPFIVCSIALFKYNKYPASVFVGDSYCYFAGMTIAVSGILGHFSEEILLFTLPQLFNFVISLPQLFKLLPCPRHRLPSLNPKTELLEPSCFDYDPTKLNRPSFFVLEVLKRLKLVRIEKLPSANSKSRSNGSTHQVGNQYRSTNLTLINLWLYWFGPKKESILCKQLLYFQATTSFVSLIIISALKLNL